jgi:hypothetical protein
MNGVANAQLEEHQKSQENIRDERKGMKRKGEGGVLHDWAQKIKAFAPENKHIQAVLENSQKKGVTTDGLQGVFGAGMAGFGFMDWLIDTADLAWDFVKGKKAGNVKPPPLPKNVSNVKPPPLPKSAGTQVAGKAVEEVAERGVGQAGKIADQAAKAGKVVEEAGQGAKAGRIASMFKGVPKTAGGMNSVIPSLRSAGGVLRTGKEVVRFGGRVMPAAQLGMISYNVGQKTVEAWNSNEINPYTEEVNRQLEDKNLGIWKRVKLGGAKHLGHLLFAIDQGQKAGLEVIKNHEKERSAQGNENPQGLLGKLAQGASNWLATMDAAYESVTTTAGYLIAGYGKQAVNGLGPTKTPGEIRKNRDARGRRRNNQNENEQGGSARWRLPSNGHLDRGDADGKPKIVRAPVQESVRESVREMAF